jgi:hypothetical protein
LVLSDYVADPLEGTAVSVVHPEFGASVASVVAVVTDIDVVVGSSTADSSGTLVEIAIDLEVPETAEFEERNPFDDSHSGSWEEKDSVDAFAAGVAVDEIRRKKEKNTGFSTLASVAAVIVKEVRWMPASAESGEVEMGVD